jgi:hypothetical protein
VKSQERGLHSSHKSIKKGKTSIPLGGRDFWVWKVGKGLEKVGKGWEAKVMLRGSLSNHHSNIPHLLTHYYNFYILPCLDFSN